MRVGFYLNTDHLNTWNWENILDGRVALSGTDGMVFRVVHALASRSDVETTLLTTVAGTSSAATPASQVAVDDFSEAVQHAHSHRFEILVFVNTERLEIIDGLSEAEHLQQTCISWCHNGPWSRMATLYANTSAVKRVICVSPPHADLFRDRRVFEKMSVIPNGLDIDRYRPKSSTSSNDRTACYVGALTPAKGFHHLAQAWPQVRASFPEARLIVVGSARLYNRNADLGPLNVAHPEYEQKHLIPNLGSTRTNAKEKHGVEFRDLLPPKDVRDVLHSSAVGVVNPNTDPAGSLETFCVTAVEMQAAETAVVGGNRRGLRETVRDGETGHLIDAPDQLASTLCRLFANPDDTRRMGMRGREWVEKYDLTHVVERWEQVLTATAQGKTPDPPPFSVRRATTKTMIREGIRRLHALAGDRRVPLLDRLLDTVRSAG